MKIIICGVGRVGLSIASYLSMHDNQITIIDTNAELVKRVSDTYDLAGIVGHASQPSVLAKAGAEDADIIIAVTNCDEINMVACQVAHSVFGINKKIARIRNKDYRDAAWSNLFSRNHMPIDIIISPEEEVADTILKRMSVPGTTNDIDFVDEKIHVFGYTINEDSQIIDNEIKNIYYANRDVEFKIFALLRNGKSIHFDDNEKLISGDEIYIICAQTSVYDVLEKLGNNNNIYNGNIIICGGGVIGEAIAKRIQKLDIFKNNDLVIVEKDLNRGRVLNRSIKNALILNGSALSHDLLKEANVSKASVFVSVMNSDESNILSAVLAKKMGAKYAIALSTNKFYSQLLPDQFVDAIVNPETITVSRILHNLRQGNIHTIHSIRDTGIEIIEAVVTKSCNISNKPIGELKMHEKINFLSIYRPETDKIIFINDKTTIMPGDYVVISAINVPMKHIEELFSFPINLFN